MLGGRGGGGRARSCSSQNLEQEHFNHAIYDSDEFLQGLIGPVKEGPLILGTFTRQQIFMENEHEMRTYTASALLTT